MSRSNYQNLKEAYLSDIGPIRENYNSPNCTPTTNNINKCSATQKTYNQQYIPKPTLFDWFPDCRQKTFACPPVSYKLSNWENCVNGIQKRTVYPVYDGSGKPEASFVGTIMSESCGTPCVYTEQKGQCVPNPVSGPPGPNTPGRIPCFINKTVHPGTFKVTHVKTQEARDGGSCNPPPPERTENCNYSSCTIENIVKYLLTTDNAFVESVLDTRTNQMTQSIATARFISAFKRLVGGIKDTDYKGGYIQFLKDTLDHLEKIYPGQRGISKCKIENFKLLINSMGVTLPSSKISPPPIGDCKLQT